MCKVWRVLSDLEVGWSPLGSRLLSLHSEARRRPAQREARTTAPLIARGGLEKSDGGGSNFDFQLISG